MSSAKPFLAIMTVLVPLASAQTVDQIVARSIQARGGLARIKSVRTVRQTERVIMGQMPESPAVVIQKRPGMVRGEFHFPGLDLVEAYDGHTAWSMPNHSQVSPMSADSARQLQESADIDGPLVDYGGK
ncbi:MAG TPA: hypothetical protein VKT29_04920, partial [Terriglobales bacterium]|nr:hypothetical protein [Terriglobales bacterium]